MRRATYSFGLTVLVKRTLVVLCVLLEGDASLLALSCYIHFLLIALEDYWVTRLPTIDHELIMKSAPTVSSGGYLLNPSASWRSEL